MKKSLLFPILFVSLSAHSDSKGLEITAHGRGAEEAKQVLLKLLDSYDLSDYIYTKKIEIESGVIPHSHPVLTLKAEEKDSPEILLGTFIHEQMHWYWIQNSPGRDIGPRVDFKLKYPSAPTQVPLGSGSADSTYQHIGVCWLEYQGLIRFLGDERANAVLSEKSYYTWIYKTVLEDSAYIGTVMKKYNMDHATH